MCPRLHLDISPNEYQVHEIPLKKKKWSETYPCMGKGDFVHSFF